MIAALVFAVAANPVTIHVRVDGGGFLRFAKNAQILYAPEATLAVQSGVLSTSDGAVIIPRIHVPANCFKLTVSLEGRFTAVTPSGSSEIGQIVLSMLDTAGGPGLFRSSQRGALSNPGDGLAGVIRTSSKSGSSAKGEQNPAAGQPLKIVVRQISEIDNDTMTLGDIAAFTGDKDRKTEAQMIDLGRTPQLGTAVRFSEGYIATKLKLAGFKSDDYILLVPEGATVTRPFQIITASTMLDTALQKIKERFDVSVNLIPDATVPELKVPKGDLVLSAELGAKTDRSIGVLIMVDVDGKRVGSRSITLVPTEDQVGVKIGDQVTIRFIDAGATVEITGKVKTAGWVGQTVSVQADTGSIHTAKVISSSLVEVRL